MAFGINRKDLREWKQEIDNGKIAFLTHYWLDERFPDCKTVTKAGAKDIDQLAEWGKKYGLMREWIDERKKEYPHFDLLGDKQKMILENENLHSHLNRFFR
ncbi:hypothetical protein FZC84_11530 [Rossellomorea vietnamensis]|uniref:YneQ n=1 Tax=Rossellomorea vietnamensis TaxID=218284 RepID=A0A5D4MDG3_9BACI|nr:hypothetical protein [Rossellomorea vietnamensis]TYR99373.1 hypothetical protein FZC84_11530 [Rossellomorea vietnamensis]